MPYQALPSARVPRSEEHTSELQSQFHLVCRLLLENGRAQGRDQPDQESSVYDDAADAEIYTLSLHDALPIWSHCRGRGRRRPRRWRRSSCAGRGSCRRSCCWPTGSRCRTRRCPARGCQDRKSTRLNSSHSSISYAVFCLKTGAPRAEISPIRNHPSMMTPPTPRSTLFPYTTLFRSGRIAEVEDDAGLAVGGEVVALGEGRAADRVVGRLDLDAVPGVAQRAGAKIGRAHV